MLDPREVALFAKIVHRGGTVVCNAATRDRLLACAAALWSEAWADVCFRITPHMPDGHIAAFTHDSRSAPVELTDRAEG